MKNLNRRLPSVPAHQFSMVPRGDVPRSTFASTATYKTTLDADVLVPIFVEEVLPGDAYKGHGTIFLRMSTPVFPVMDNVHLDAFFFFVPNRLVWSNWQKFMGQQADPSSSIDFLVPQADVTDTYNVPGSLFDYFGIPSAVQLTAATAKINALPLRGYLLIWNEWFRDQNLQNSAGIPMGDGPDTAGFYANPAQRGKRHDYFTSCLPWPLKGGASVNLPIGGQAAVKTRITPTVSGAQNPISFNESVGGAVMTANRTMTSGAAGGFLGFTATAGTSVGNVYPSNLYADLSTASGATINSLRLAVATQQLLERDARGGTRYAELLRSHFGVDPQDARLQRPEYIGGGSLTLQTQAIPQTTPTVLPASTDFAKTPIGSLGGTTVGNGGVRFQYAATEHGFIIGLVAIRADLTYQQGIHRMWTRQTKYDYYWPAYAFLGEQAVTVGEIYATGTAATDAAVFGYQERWSEYRYRQSLITGMFRSGIAGTLDAWHLAENFAGTPSLNSTFIQSTTPMARVLAAAALAAKQQFLLDSVWNVSATRPIPARSVPGLHRF